MPELPEVESVVYALKTSSLVGKTLSSIKLICPKISTEIKTLVGQSLQNIERRGKYIDFIFSNGLHLIVHLRMTGQFLIKTIDDLPARHERVIFDFNREFNLAFHDTRRFATFDVTKTPEVIFNKLGFEPLDLGLSYETFFNLLKSRQKTIKAQLLDQTFLAGIGNIYADEALWQAKIHPEQLSCDLDHQKSKKLLESIRNVLLNGIKNGGTSLGSGAPNFHHLNGQSGKNQNALNVYGKEESPCQRCGTLIKKIVVQQRGTHFCPACQKLK